MLPPQISPCRWRNLRRKQDAMQKMLKYYEKKKNKQTSKKKTETKNQKKKTKTKTEKKLNKINQITACTIVVSVKTLRHARTHYYEKWETELLNMRLSCTLRSKSLDLIRDFCESPKSGTSDIGDYQSLVLRFVKITMLLNHGNVGDRPNSLKKIASCVLGNRGMTDIGD